jgi:hypothetical protein
VMVSDELAVTERLRVAALRDEDVVSDRVALPVVGLQSTYTVAVPSHCAVVPDMKTYEHARRSVAPPAQKTSSRNASRDPFSENGRCVGAIGQARIPAPNIMAQKVLDSAGVHRGAHMTPYAKCAVGRTLTYPRNGNLAFGRSMVHCQWVSGIVFGAVPAISAAMAMNNSRVTPRRVSTAPVSRRTTLPLGNV